ncbi:hypothetical protein EWH99_10650 [Sporolactobacillus sp. THM7-7]|nr:hypothetical protein EWH99_10650 [Sporolactobacillus sp. THM7-7]
MELKETADKFIEAIGCKSFQDMPARIMKAVMGGEAEVYEAYLKLCPDLTVDWMQRIWQFYLADREDKKQDFTPPSLAKLLAKLTRHKGEKVVYDCCAGSGALTIHKWNTNHNLKFVCEELDANVIPLLLFNLSVRNIEATVINGNVLSEDHKAVYTVNKGKRFGTVENSGEAKFKADSCISNPPYNIKWEWPLVGEFDPRFTESGLPPKSNANYAFVLHMLSKLKNNGRMAAILPNGCLTSDPEQNIREYLVSNGKMESVIQLPNRMFESTSIPTCILSLTPKGNENISMIDARGSAEKVIREQRGGSTDADVTHRARIYKKEINVLKDDAVNKIIATIHKKSDEPDFSKTIDVDDAMMNSFALTPSRYIEHGNEEPEHRPLSEIANDIHRLSVNKNAVKLTINETLARDFGMSELSDLMKQNNDLIAENNKNMKQIGINLNLSSDRYITTSKSRVLKIELMDKEKVPTIFNIIMLLLIQRYTFFNDEEDKLMRELRDALLPELMSGRIRVPEEMVSGEN